MRLGAGFTLDVSYSGNKSVHLMDQRQVNALPAGYTPQNPECAYRSQQPVQLLCCLIEAGAI